MITMWIMASQIGMECRWLLFLPFEHSAYRGLVADAYMREQGERSPDLCTYEAITTIFAYMSALYVCMYRTNAWLYLLVAVVIVKAVLHYAEYVCIYGLYFEHKCLLATVSLIPGVSLLCALKVRRA